MALTNTTSGGVIGLGSRLFIGVETNWGTMPTGQDLTGSSWKQFNIYNQAGSRPQKVKNSIEVSQLYPSVVRRKTIKNTTQIEGSYVFSIPTTSSGIFWEMITGDSAPTGGKIVDDALHATQATALRNEATAINDSSNIDATQTTITVDSASAGFIVAGDTIKIQLEELLVTSVTSDTSIVVERAVNGTTGATHADNLAIKNLRLILSFESEVIATTGDYEGQTITVSGVTTTTLADQAEIDIINSSHLILTSTSGSPDKVKVDTNLDISAITIANVTTDTSAVDVVISGTDYSIQEDFSNSFRLVQTHGLSFASRYDGMMASTATINIAPDDVANVDITFLGKEETTVIASADELGSLFKGEADSGGQESPFNHSGDGSKATPFKITSLKSAVDAFFDNFVDFYPSYSASLYLAKKAWTAGSAGAEGNTAFSYLTGIHSSGTSDFSNAQDANWKDGSDTSETPHSAFLVPFADATITVTNNVDFPAYINGTNTRTQPVQTGYREVTLGLTLPYNQFTFPMIQSMFDEDSWACKIILDYSATGGASKGITFSLPEICITGDGGLSDIPEGEITIPLTFTAYAPHDITTTAGISEDGTGYDLISNKAPFAVYLTS